MTKYKKLTVEFPTNEFLILKAKCAKKNTSLKDFVYNAINLYLNDIESSKEISKSEGDSNEQE